MTLNEKALEAAVYALLESFKQQDQGYWKTSQVNEGKTILDGEVDLVVAIKSAIEAYEAALKGQE